MLFNPPPLHQPHPRDAAARAAASAPHRHRNRRLIVLGVLFLFFALVALVFLGVGRWLVVEDPLAPANVIVVLSGQMPERAAEAARIFNQGAAPEIWITKEPGPADQLAKYGVHFVGEDFYDEAVLLALKVPADSILILDPPTTNTEAEIDQIAAQMRNDGLASAIIVTSKPHTRRVRAIWNRRADPSLHLIVRYPDDDAYDAAHWWRHTRDALDVVREVLGLLNAWAGFPLKAR